MSDREPASSATSSRSAHSSPARAARLTDPVLPAWTEPFVPEARDKLVRAGALRQVDREAWGGATGAGVKVAIIDSGVEGTHPVVAGRLVRSVAVQIVDDEPQVVDDEGIDMYGHATACGGIVGLAPAVEIYSVRVLGSDLKGKVPHFWPGSSGRSRRA